MKPIKSLSPALRRIFEASLTKRYRGADNVEVAEVDGVITVREISPEPRMAVCPGEVRAGANDDTFEISFSSESPVRVWGENEILSHDPNDADFSRLKEVGAILKNHNPDKIVAVPVDVRLDLEARKGRATCKWGTTEDALEARQEAMVDKSLRGVSVGYIVDLWVYLKDDTILYNGRIKGPAWVAARWHALEASLTPIAADPTVGMNRKIPQGDRQPQPEEEQTMGKNVIDTKTETDEARLAREAAEETAGTAGAGARTETTKKDLATREADQVAAQTETRKIATEVAKDTVTAERKRSRDIVQLCTDQGMSELAEGFIQDGTPVDTVKARVLDKLSERNKPVGAQVVRDGRTSTLRAMVDGLLLRGGRAPLGEKPTEGCSDFRGQSLLRLAEDSLRRSNIGVPTDPRAMVELAMRGPKITSHDIDRFLRAGEVITGSTGDFPLLLAVAGNKSLLEGYRSARVTFPKWCKIGSLNDFKQAGRIRLSSAGELELIPENQAYKNAAFSEKREPIQLATFGKLWTMSRQGIINDDLDGFTIVPFRLGEAARRKPNRLAVTVLLANAALTDGIALFAAGHSNYDAAAANALDSEAHARDGLKTLVQKLRTQKAMLPQTEKDQGGTFELELEPAIALMPASGEFYGKIALNSTSLPGSTAGGVINPFAGIAEPVVEPLLENTTIPGASALGWYLFANPMLAPVIEVAFLQGNQEPFLEEVDQTNVDGRVIKVRLDTCAAAVDFAGACFEKGEA